MDPLSHSLKDEIARWGRALEHGFGEDFHLCVLGADNAMLWASVGSDGFASLPPIHDELPRECFTELADGLIQVISDDTGKLGAPVFMAISRACSPSAEKLDKLAAALNDAAISIAGSMTLQDDVDGLSQELAMRYEEINLVVDLDKCLNLIDTQEEMLRNILDASILHLDVDTVSYIEVKSEQVFTAFSDIRPIRDFDLVEVEMRGDLLRFLQAVREAVVINSMTDERRRYIMSNMPYKILACPVMVGGGISAIVTMLRHDDRPDFSNSDRSLAVVMANQLASVLSLRKLIDDLERFSSQMAKALVETIEAKDPYTRGHSERVQAIALMIGTAMGFGRVQKENLSWAALLHDIGKIGVPDALLTKPSGLASDEYAIVKSHPTRSYEILRHIEYLNHEVLAGVKHHHEYWNGSGYPDGLIESDIPLLARVIAVADTYDSITSTRAYRAGRSHDAAMREIARVSGTQLEPGIVKVLQDICTRTPDQLGVIGSNRRER